MSHVQLLSSMRIGRLAGSTNGDTWKQPIDPQGWSLLTDATSWAWSARTSEPTRSTRAVSTSSSATPLRAVLRGDRPGALRSSNPIGRGWHGFIDLIALPQTGTSAPHLRLLAVAENGDLLRHR
jgi:hypothetical protein